MVSFQCLAGSAALTKPRAVLTRGALSSGSTRCLQSNTSQAQRKPKGRRGKLMRKRHKPFVTWADSILETSLVRHWQLLPHIHNLGHLLRSTPFPLFCAGYIPSKLRRSVPLPRLAGPSVRRLNDQQGCDQQVCRSPNPEEVAGLAQLLVQTTSGHI